MVSQKHSDKVCFIGCHTYASVVDIAHFFIWALVIIMMVAMLEDQALFSSP